MQSKKILVVNGIFDGHFTGSVEIVRDLVSLGHNVTCYVLDEFANRLKDIGAKLVIIQIDRSDFNKLPPQAPRFATKGKLLAKVYDALLSLLLKEENKYDYYLFDAFFEIREMNKLLKIPSSKFILICTAFIFTDEEITENPREGLLKPINLKYNINLNDFLLVQYVPNKFKKLIVTSKYFHLRGEKADDTCFFIGPKIEPRKKDENFKFVKDKNKKLIFISLGTIFNVELDFYSNCIEAFKDSEEFQVIISLGKNRYS